MEEQNEDKKRICPHCGQMMKKWVPHYDSSWDMTPQFVCFNDECPYYVKGWEWMREKYNQHASYRHRYDPQTGDSGPLPVAAPEAHTGGIVEDDEQ